MSATWLALAALGGCKGKVELEPTVTDPTPAPTQPAGLHPGTTSVDLAIPSGFQESEIMGHFTRGRSCTVADFDLDGLQDIALGNPSDETYLLRNVSSGPGDVRFELQDILVDTETEDTSLAWSIQAADYDNDGDFDLFLAMGGIEGLEFNHLFRNQLVETGTLSFVDVAAQAGVLGPRDQRGEFVKAPNAGLSWADFDIDGDLDLFISQDVFPLRSYDRLRRTDWMGYNTLFLNDGAGGFVESGRAAGLSTQEPTRHASVADFDNDGDLDLYESNFTKFNHIWRNQFTENGAVTFVDVTEESTLEAGGSLAYPLETFSSAAADLNNDGWEDLIAFQRGYATLGPYGLGHTVFLNVEGRGFVDATALSNLNDPFEPGLRNHAFNGVMGSTPADMNGDGLVDIYIGNGGPESGELSQLFVAAELVDHEFPGIGTLAVPRFENWSDLIQFPAEEDPEAIASGVEYPPFPYRTHGVCVADFDRDGVVEIAVQEGGTYLWGGEISREPNRLFQLRTPGEHHWVAIRPVGDGVTVPRDGIGTRLHAVLETPGGGERHVWNTLRGGNGFSANLGFEMFVGLGDAVAIRSIDVIWSDGQHTLLDAPASDRVHEVRR